MSLFVSPCLGLVRDHMLRAAPHWTVPQFSANYPSIFLIHTVVVEHSWCAPQQRATPTGRLRALAAEMPARGRTEDCTANMTCAACMACGPLSRLSRAVRWWKTPPRCGPCCLSGRSWTFLTFSRLAAAAATGAAAGEFGHCVLRRATDRGGARDACQGALFLGDVVSFSPAFLDLT